MSIITNQTKNILDIIRDNMSEPEKVAQWVARVFAVNSALDTHALRDMWAVMTASRYGLPFEGAFKNSTIQYFNEMAEQTFSITTSYTRDSGEMAPIIWICALAAAMAAAADKAEDDENDYYAERTSTFQERQAAYELSMGI